MRTATLAGILVILLTGLAGAEEAPTDETAALEPDVADEPSTDPLTDPGDDAEPVKTPAEKRQAIYTDKVPEDRGLSGFAKRSKNPTDWLNWGYDLRLRDIYQKNPITNDKHAPPPSRGGPGNEYHFQRYRSRLWFNIKPIKDIEIRTRLIWEFRNYCKPDGRRKSDIDEALFDKLNVKWTHVLGTPTTVVAGRQDIILGDGWLVLDGTPLDGSRTIYFDAVRVTNELKSIQTNVDWMFINQFAESDHFIEPFNDRERLLEEQDARGAILWVSNKSLPGTELNGYFIYKHLDAAAPNENHPTWRGDDGDIYTVGGRIHGEIGKNWDYRFEIAKQMGNKNKRRLCALGANSRLMYKFNDAHKNRLHIGYEYLSGDRPGTEKNEAFDILWGRWPQFSELYIYAYAGETRIADVTNLHRIGLGWITDPIKDWEFCLNYHFLFAGQNTYRDRPGFSKSGCVRGQLATAILRYKFNDFISGHLLGEAFFPGDYYDNTRNDPSVMLRYELTFRW
jgi:hypothetical protein